MLKVLCLLLITALIGSAARIAEVTEVIVMVDQLAYIKKSYAASAAIIDSNGELTDIVYPGPCTGAPNASLPNYGFTCTLLQDLMFRDQVKGIVSGF